MFQLAASAYVIVPMSTNAIPAPKTMRKSSSRTA